ncbi:outer membrane protein assembly factor BamD [Dysgonomonas sp. GY617]|uniref:outer membrane protein assembly factor BamD n=1 Tax=Dysgonomonas sp. GY617 TaxID=2780420 RepID=UPI00188326A3|nr:outer membrane protein assembly factor BamD [Dysgonomonas sp. GY617]MBF0577851.1 outer membrane protein assembly factor BamD [Dysgonomonas sp. GY617]
MKIRILLVFVLTLLVATSCGEYNKILKSTDYELKYTYAKKYFDEKKYGRASTLLEELVPIFKGTSHAEESLFLLAQSFFYDKDYTTATQYFKAYYTTYPKGEFTELARFNAAYGLYLDIPDVRLDQTNTYKSMQEFQTFLEIYPQSDKIQLVQDYLFEMQEKLALKELMACRLYFNLGNYMGNNYESCVVTAREALKTYPYSQYREEFQILILRSRHEVASKSIVERTAERYRDVIDEHYNYLNMFPEGKYKREADRYYRRAVRALDLKIEGMTDEELENENKLERK